MTGCRYHILVAGFSQSRLDAIRDLRALASCRLSFVEAADHIDRLSEGNRIPILLRYGISGALANRVVLEAKAAGFDIGIETEGTVP